MSDGPDTGYSQTDDRNDDEEAQDVNVIHALHHHKAPLIFSVETETQGWDGGEHYIKGRVIIRAPGVVGNMTPVGYMEFEYDGHGSYFYDMEVGENYAHAHSLVKEKLYKSEQEHEANRKEIRLAAGLMEIACNKRRCFRLVDRLVTDAPVVGVSSEFERCVATASVALSCTDQETVENTFDWYRHNVVHEEVAPCEHVEPGDDPCSSCIESYIDPRGRIQ